MLRVLKNLEDQAGCVAHLLVAYVDPTTGTSSVQRYVRAVVNMFRCLTSLGTRFCQGKTAGGVDFHGFCGEDWANVIEPRFNQWGMAIFGGTFLFHLGGGRATGTDSVCQNEGAIVALSSCSPAHLLTFRRVHRPPRTPGVFLQRPSAHSLKTRSESMELRPTITDLWKTLHRHLSSSKLRAPFYRMS